MRILNVAGLLALLWAAAAISRAEESFVPARPQKEHQWLQQLVGEWESEVEVFTEPGQPPVTSKGTESVRSIGGFWIVGENQGDILGLPFTSLLTLGYDSEKQKYVGTWVDSMAGYLWTYQGSLDTSGKVLTLNTEGPCPMKPGETSRIRETIELKSKDHKVLSSAIQQEDGTWTTLMTINYRRKD